MSFRPHTLNLAAAGTALLADIIPGPGNSSPTGMTALGNGKVLFAAIDVSHGQELWVTDGTAAGMALVMDIYPGSHSSYLTGFTAVGDGTALFSADDGTHGVELWRSDGSAAGTSLVGTAASGTSFGFGDITVAAAASGRAGAPTRSNASYYQPDTGMPSLLIGPAPLAPYNQT